MSEPFDVTGYWERRYAGGKTSGSGSYGRLAAYKADLLNNFVKNHEVTSVIEFGCGDGNQLTLAEYPRYIGYDVSMTAIAKCREIFSNDPSKEFHLISEYTGGKADLVLSLDVIYHLVEDDLFDSYMHMLFDAADRYVIIYSSNDQFMRDVNQHVRHRRFTDWTAKRSGFRLLSRIENPYHVRNKPTEAPQTEFAPSDFYIFKKELPSNRMFNWRHPNRRAELNSLRAGRIPVPPAFGLPDIDYTTGVDWGIFNNQPPPVRWWLNHLKLVRPLLLSSEPSDTEKAVKIIKSWVDANSVEPQSDYAWDGHATAFRSEHIACLKTKISEDWLDRAGVQHAEFLSDPKNYQGNWNHGLDQNIGLLSLGYAFDRLDWIHLARDRAITAISKMVDWQGVSIEQAISYHFYNYVRFQDAEIMFKDCGAPLPPEIFERVRNMPTFLAHATTPDGRWNCLGDSTDDKSERERLHDTDAGYALSRGARGVRPSARFAVYYSGYVFGRSGWGESRPSQEESYYSLRFGPGRLIHGHNDHMSVTYFSKGHDIIIDGGFHGYTQDNFRNYLRTPAAHNVVYTPDNVKFFWNSRTVLKEFTIERHWQNYLLEDAPYPKTKRIRSVLYIQSPIECMIVLDRLTGPSRRYEQAWHFDQKMSLREDGEYIEASSSTSSVSVHQLWPHDGIEIVEGQQDPLQGWAGYGTFDVRPVPTIITKRKGSMVTFLTAIVVQSSGADHVQLHQRPVKQGGVLRDVSIRIGKSTVIASILDDDTIQVKDIPSGRS